MDFYKRVENARIFFENEKDNCALLTLYGVYNRDFEKAKYIYHDEELAETVNVNIVAIQSVLLKRLKGGK